MKRARVTIGGRHCSLSRGLARPRAQAGLAEEEKSIGETREIQITGMLRGAEEAED